MKGCLFCGQKAEWKAEQLNAIRKEAKQYAEQNEETYIIYKEGTLYGYCKISEGASRTVIEYISKHPSLTTQ